MDDLLLTEEELVESLLKDNNANIPESLIHYYLPESIPTAKSQLIKTIKWLFGNCTEHYKRSQRRIYCLECKYKILNSFNIK